MNYNLRELIDNSDWDLINQLIKLGTIQLDVAVNEVMEMNNAKYIYYFAREVDGAPIKELARGMLQTKEAEYIYYFAYDIDEAPIYVLAQAVIKAKDARYIYEFARDIEGAPIAELAQGVIQTKDAAWIYRFAHDVEGAPIKELARAVLQMKDAHNIFHFARDIAGAPIEMLVNGLIELKSYFWIGLILSTIGTQNSNRKGNGELEKYALEHKEELLKVIEECTNIDILQDIRSHLKASSLILYVDQLIQRLTILNEEQ